MTTRVTIDSHAGLPVMVVTEVGEPKSSKSIVVDIVEPNTGKDFYIHSGMKIISIQEVPN